VLSENRFMAVGVLAYGKTTSYDVDIEGVEGVWS
jgi:hypothetical protein